jgi:hypothetical protein
MGGIHARRARRVVAVVVMAALATACAGGGGTSAVPPTTEAPATSAPPATRAPRPVPARYAGYRSGIYTDPVHWVCRPDADDVCDHELDATVVAADGTLTPEPFRPATDPPVDCFYVYPTISRDPTPNSDLTASPTEEGAAARSQVARLATHCRVFAPTYRQVTLAALTSAMGGAPMAGVNAGQGFADVLEAWKHYMANDNGGRGVVLVGHSQGAGVISQLIRTEIDPDADVRDQLVAAYIAGSALKAGGDFANVPLCGRPDQVGCALSWASFRSTSPPPSGSRFGRVRGSQEPAACVSPAALTGGRAMAKPYFGRNPGASIIAVGGDAASSWVDPAEGTVATPFVSTPGLVEVECVQRDGFGYLEVTVHGDPADPRTNDIGGDLTPDWGLHLIDIGLVMGDMVDLVGRQAAAYTKG